MMLTLTLTLTLLTNDNDISKYTKQRFAFNQEMKEIVIQ